MRKVYKDFLTDQPHRTFNIVGSDGQAIHNNIYLEDTTIYTQTGDKFGAGDINKAVENIIHDNIIIQANSWVGNIATINLAEVTLNSVHEILPAKVTRPTPTTEELANTKAFASANLQDAGQETGKLYIYAEKVPSVDLKVRVISCL